ncbi:hypothetical protein CR513_62855, partial [Mucuna pruriens]
IFDPLIILIVSILVLQVMTVYLFPIYLLFLLCILCLFLNLHVKSWLILVNGMPCWKKCLFCILVPISSSFPCPLARLLLIVIRCIVYTMKIGLNDSIGSLKVRLATKGYIFVLLQCGMTKCEVDHFIIFIHYHTNNYFYLVVYVDDIVITNDNETNTQCLKDHLSYRRLTVKTIIPTAKIGRHLGAKLIYDNQVSFPIVSNIISHENTKIDCHFAREKVQRNHS